MPTYTVVGRSDGTFEIPPKLALICERLGNRGWSLRLGQTDVNECALAGQRKGGEDLVFLCGPEDAASAFSLGGTDKPDEVVCNYPGLQIFCAWHKPGFCELSLTRQARLMSAAASVLGDALNDPTDLLLLCAPRCLEKDEIWMAEEILRTSEANIPAFNLTEENFSINAVRDAIFAAEARLPHFNSVSRG